MAPGFCFCRSLCRNPASANSVNNELTDGPPGAPTKSSATPVSTLRAPSCNLTLVPVPTPALIPAPAPTATSTTNELFKQFMQVYLAAQTLGQDTGLHERHLKA